MSIFDRGDLQMAHSFPVSDQRKCTCHPDDNPPVPCAQKYALGACFQAEALSLRQRVADLTRALERIAEMTPQDSSDAAGSFDRASEIARAALAYSK